MDPPASVSKWNIFWIYCGIFLPLVDIIIDYYVCIKFFIDGVYLCGIFTAAFVYIPAFINILISWRMYKQDEEMRTDICAPTGASPKEKPDEEKKKRTDIDNRNRCSWPNTKDLILRKKCWPLVILIPMVPALRCINTLEYALKVREYERTNKRDNQSETYKKMQKEEEDVAFLRVIECCLEAAPQASLQMTFLLQNYQQEFGSKQRMQVSGICLSLLCMGYTIANYSRVTRAAQETRSDITPVGIVLRIFEHTFIIASRIVSVGAAASIWVMFTGIAIVIHWIALTICISIVYSTSMRGFIRDRRRALHTDLTSREKIETLMLAAVHGVVYFFVFINLSNGKTRRARWFYYGFFSIGNIIACGCWAHFATPDITAQWWYALIIVLCIVPFLIGITAMLLYYSFPRITKRERPAVTSESNEVTDTPSNHPSINGASNDSELTRLNEQL